MRIPVYQPDLSGNEKRYVNDCLDAGWISSRGEYVRRFEEAFGRLLGIPYCATVSSGTTALQTALGALGIGPGDEVIVPTFTYVASVNTVAATGATPVLVDSLADSWQMDPADVQRKVTSRTRAVMAVHLYGSVCPMDELTALASRHGLALIEDCAEAFGSKWDGRYAGTWGDVAAFSFFGNKTITTGEGGMVATRSAELDRRIRAYKSQGLSLDREYWHDSIGFNYRMTNVCAAIGLAQLERADALIVTKRLLAQWYRKHLEGVPVEVHRETAKVFHTWWMVSILCPTPEDREPLRLRLREEGVETRPLFHPAHTMPVHAHLTGHFPRAENIALRGMNLPSWPGLTEDDVRFIAGVIRRYFTR